MIRQTSLIGYIKEQFYIAWPLLHLSSSSTTVNQANLIDWLHNEIKESNYLRFAQLHLANFPLIYQASDS